MLTSMTDEATSPHTFLLTNNPDLWDIEADELAKSIEDTAAGRGVDSRWSTGSTTKKIQNGDRVFLLRQRVEHRGIFASGHFVSTVFQAEHWDNSGRQANYANVLWDTFLAPDDVLPIEVLSSELPEGQWAPQASGTQIKEAVTEHLEQLWAAHVASVRGNAPRTSTTSGPVNARQGRLLDAALRRELEDFAQQRLMDFYEDDGWDVEDLRTRNSFDARATKDEAVLYLEAKGTVTDGERVIVTRGEVKWARGHPEECVIGILSGVKLTDQGIDEKSGTLRRYNWMGKEIDLTPRQYDFQPPTGDELH